MFLLAAQRAKDPGPFSKADTMLVLQGEEGLNKSSVFQWLCPDPAWYLGNLSGTIGTVRAQMDLRGKWFVELAEMEALDKAHIATVMAFIAQVADDYRGPWEPQNQLHYRRCIFVGTANTTEIIADVFGGRRWVVIPCLKPAVKAEVLAARTQLWAEAQVVYDQYVAQGRPVVDREVEAIFTAGNSPYLVRGGYDHSLELWLNVEVKGQWFHLIDAFHYLLPNKDLSDFNREMKQITRALRRLGCVCKRKKFKPRVDGWRSPESG